jgi:hypothetical protein
MYSLRPGLSARLEFKFCPAIKDRVGLTAEPLLDLDACSRAVQSIFYLLFRYLLFRCTSAKLRDA